MKLQLARDPASLVFLLLGEALRRQGDLAAALVIAESGVAWYPEMAGAWDLLARVRSDQGEGDLAFDAWTTALRFDPDHAGAHKGLAFLAFRAGELDRSARHVRRALELSPADPALGEVLARVSRAAVARAPVEPAGSPLFAAGVSGRALLVDLRGGLLDGRVESPAGTLAGNEIGPALAGLSRDAERTARLLGLGRWRRISLAGKPGPVEIRGPTSDSILMLTGPAATEPDLGAEADRLASASGAWLEALR